MKIVFYGVTGTFGHRLWQEALRHGHTASVVARAMTRLTPQAHHRRAREDNGLTHHRVGSEVTERVAVNGLFGVLRRHPEFASRYVAPRHVDVWLPPHYQDTPSRRFPVIYTHDGQNLFDPQSSFLGVDWGIDEAMRKLTTVQRARAAIVVGVWNTPQRSQEYMPQRPLEMISRMRGERGQSGKVTSRTPLSDRYLKFLFQEVKPFIDKHYRTLADRENTFVMGSSMGGLISLYAVCEYPHVVAGAGCLSPHWPARGGVVVDYLEKGLPEAGNHKLYFDHGTLTVDALYEPYQQEVDMVMRAKGYTQGEDWLTLKFEGAEHSERAWRERVHLPLGFLLGGEVSF
jgi:predicted alpha/beta superfamily hydrolase